MCVRVLLVAFSQERSVQQCSSAFKDRIVLFFVVANHAVMLLCFMIVHLFTRHRHDPLCSYLGVGPGP